jgi:hypothetical protein
VEKRRARCRSIGFRCIRPFELRGKEPPDPAYVSSSPSKIPDGGFSPVRLQTGFLRHGLRQLPSSLSGRSASATQGLTYTRPIAFRCTPMAHRACNRGSWLRRSSPEALGSPTGSVVRPGPRLLRPHLRLSVPPAALWIMQPALARRSALGWVREGPHFTLCVCALRAVFRTPMDRAVALGCFFTAHTGLRLIRTGSASTSPHTTVLAWACNEAAKFP